jgi:hypothetical protein
MLGSLVKRLFCWFVELFDNKIIPNIPGDNGGTWFSKPFAPFGGGRISEPKYKSLIVPSNLKIPDFIETPSLRELYKNSTPNTKSWYNYITDYNTLWWIGVTAGTGTIGVIYLGYNLVANPLFLQDIFNSNPRTNIQPPNPSCGGNQPDNYYWYYSWLTLLVAFSTPENTD